jgi:valyl-tRNA synthetase
VLIHVLKTVCSAAPVHAVHHRGNLHQTSGDETIMLSNWPKQDERFRFDADCAHLTLMMELIRSIRNIRAEMRFHRRRRSARA